ncbi:MAG TPA: hypothetical protein V6C81_03010 [Planktothrix sp.]|jgi:tetratricopeptide (TPR) repeat protein
MDDNTVDSGIIAYQQKEYEIAIALLETADRNDWRGQLYLGMSYYLLGKIDEAQRVFFRIKGDCPDKDLREKAEAAFAAVRAKLRDDAEREREAERARQRAEAEEVQW